MMQTYSYKARDNSGKMVKGTMAALDKADLIDKLRNMGCMATYVGEASLSINIDGLFEGLKRISVEDMIIFDTQLSNMISSGITILASLEMLGKQTENKRLRDIIGEVSRNIEAGESLSESLSRYPAVFSHLFVNMVKAGEASGKLDVVLARYAEFSEHEADLKQKINSALFYPAILLVAGIAVTLFIVTFIIPQFAEIFLKSGIRLPVPTMVLYKIGIAIKSFWFSMVLFVIAGSLAIRYYKNTAKGRIVYDRLILRLPILGPLFRKTATSRFTRTLGTLIASGVPILESLDITKGVMGNEILAAVIANARSSVERGEKISEPLRLSQEFSADTVHMISVGEETGNLDGMLNKISDFYDMSVGYTIKKLTAMLEPLFLVIMGSMVGFIMASMLLPIFDMMKILRKG